MSGRSKVKMSVSDFAVSWHLYQVHIKLSKYTVKNDMFIHLPVLMYYCSCFFAYTMPLFAAAWLNIWTHTLLKYSLLYTLYSFFTLQKKNWSFGTFFFYTCTIVLSMMLTEASWRSCYIEGRSLNNIKIGISFQLCEPVGKMT